MVRPMQACLIWPICSCLPNMTIMCPSDEAELARMTVTAAQFDDGPSAVRYPRGTGTGVQIDQPVLPVEIGKARLVHKGSECHFAWHHA